MPRKPAEPAHYVGVYHSGKDHWQFKLRLPPDPATGKRAQETRGGFLTARAAWEARERRRMELEERRAPLTRQTVRDLLDRYLESIALTVDASTHFRYREVNKTYIQPYLGNLRVRDLDTPDVRRWIATLATTGKRGRTGLATGTIKLARSVLSAALNQAVADGRLPRNPVSRAARLPNTPARPVVVLAGDDLARWLVAAQQDEHAALWLTAIYSALRPGELRVLTWQDVDLDAGVLQVRRTATIDGHGRTIVGDGPKRDAAVRAVPLPPVVVRALRQLHDRQLFLMREYAGLWVDHGYVFAGRRGQMRSDVTMREWLDALCARAGVPRVTLHQLRHSSLTLMGSLGENPKVIADRAGHTDVSFSLNRYVHPTDADQRAATERMEAFLARDDAAQS